MGLLKLMRSLITTHPCFSTHPHRMGLNSYQMVVFPHSPWKHFLPKIVLSSGPGHWGCSDCGSVTFCQLFHAQERVGSSAVGSGDGTILKGQPSLRNIKLNALQRRRTSAAQGSPLYEDIWKVHTWSKQKNVNLLFLLFTHCRWHTFSSSFLTLWVINSLRWHRWKNPLLTEVNSWHVRLSWQTCHICVTPQRFCCLSYFCVRWACGSECRQQVVMQWVFWCLKVRGSGFSSPGVDREWRFFSKDKCSHRDGTTPWQEERVR